MSGSNNGLLPVEQIQVDHRNTAREFLRIATARVLEAPPDDVIPSRVRDHLIGRAYEHGLSWEDISQETGLSVQECQEALGLPSDQERQAAA